MVGGNASKHKSTIHTRASFLEASNSGQPSTAADGKRLCLLTKFIRSPAYITVPTLTEV